MRNLHVKLLTLALVAAGLGLTTYKVLRLGLPLKPADQTEVWSVEARVGFKAKAGAAKVTLPVLYKPAGFAILDEDFVAAKYGLATEHDEYNRQALWAKRRATGKQVLYYRAVLYQDPEAHSRHELPPATPAAPVLTEPNASAVSELLEQARGESADSLSFVRQLLLRLNAPDRNPTLAMLRENADTPTLWAQDIVQVLASAGIPARVIYGLALEDGLKRHALEPWLQMHDGETWLTLHPVTAESGPPDNFLIWQIGGDALFRVEGGQDVRLQFSVARNLREMVDVAERRAVLKGSHLMDFSLFALPVQTQNVYRILLMIPLGAFVVVLMRNLVGVKTFGTFMPVLIALAFRETELWWGILLFCLIVGLGLALRFYLEHLKLLLVPRLAAVLTLVVMLMAGVSVVLHQLGLEMGVSIALFPMVIMTMTIERMSLVWEEAGPLEAIQQGLGSLAVAAVAFLVMNIALLEHLTFVFPELLLVVLAANLAMGRYTGYRLTELWRFRAFNGK
ncbi:MAG: inactive transglutaminase family protein [Nevskiales bacterium]